MKSSVLARPNLKLFLAGAILLLAVQDFMTRVHSQGTMVQARLRKERVSDDVLRDMLAKVSQSPSPELCMWLSDEYYRRGEIRRALFFLRQAERLADEFGD